MGRHREKDFTKTEAGIVYLGCESPIPFALRFKALCLAAQVKKRVVILDGIAGYLKRLEANLTPLQKKTYDLALQQMANQHGLSVDVLKRDIAVDEASRFRGMGNYMDKIFRKRKEMDKEEAGKRVTSE